MKKSKISLFVSILIFFLGLILLVLSFVLNIGNAQYVLFSMSPFSNLRTIYILRFIFVSCLIFSIILFAASIISIVKKRELTIKFILPLVILFLLSSAGITGSVMLNYKSNSVYGDYILKNGAYNNIFPYYDEMTNQSSGKAVYSSIEENSIYSSRYVCLQSSVEIEEDNLLYDVDYFESENNILLGQFAVENSFQEYDLIKKGNYGACSYCIYNNDYSYSVIFENDNSFFSMYLMNFNTINNDTDVNKLLDEASKVFQNVSENNILSVQQGEI